jgi:hypothetical protein
VSRPFLAAARRTDSNFFSFSFPYFIRSPPVLGFAGGFAGAGEIAERTGEEQHPGQESQRAANSAKASNNSALAVSGVPGGIECPARENKQLGKRADAALTEPLDLTAENGDSPANKKNLLA